MKARAKLDIEYSEKLSKLAQQVTRTGVLFLSCKRLKVFFFFFKFQAALDSLYVPRSCSDFNFVFINSVKKSQPAYVYDVLWMHESIHCVTLLKL